MTVTAKPCDGTASDPEILAACAAARLQDAARGAQAQAAGQALDVPNAGMPAIAAGVGSLTGSNQRLGADLRTATQIPRRPSAPPLAAGLPRVPRP